MTSKISLGERPFATSCAPTVYENMRETTINYRALWSKHTAPRHPRRPDIIQCQAQRTMRKQRWNGNWKWMCGKCISLSERFGRHKFSRSRGLNIKLNTKQPCLGCARDHHFITFAMGWKGSRCKSVYRRSAFAEPCNRSEIKLLNLMHNGHTHRNDPHPSASK